MSIFDKSIPKTTPDHQFDLLVDGELSEADRRALLLRLEHETDGWRRCALAFLEAQCWKSELGQITTPAQELVRTEPVSRAKPTGRWRSLRQYAATTLTVAASFLIALVVVRGWSGGSSHSPDSSQVRTAVNEFPLILPPVGPMPSLPDAAAKVEVTDSTKVMDSTKATDPTKVTDSSKVTDTTKVTDSTKVTDPTKMKTSLPEEKKRGQ